MKLKELIPLLRFSGFHSDIYHVCIDIVVGNEKPKQIGNFTTSEFAEISELEVIGISTYLTFTIWLKGEEK